MKRFFEHGDRSHIRAEQAGRIADVPAHLENAIHPSDLNLPGYRLHALKGKRKGEWSVAISGNWRVTFRFRGPDAVEVDLADYH